MAVFSFGFDEIKNQKIEYLKKMQYNEDEIVKIVNKKLAIFCRWEISLIDGY